MILQLLGEKWYLRVALSIIWLGSTDVLMCSGIHVCAVACQFSVVVHIHAHYTRMHRATYRGAELQQVASFRASRKHLEYTRVEWEEMARLLRSILYGQCGQCYGQYCSDQGLMVGIDLLPWVQNGPMVHLENIPFKKSLQHPSPPHLVFSFLLAVLSFC